MNKKFTKMPLNESHWVSIHDPEDFDRYDRYLRGLGKKVADLLNSPDARTSEPFVNGAQQAVQRYNITTRAHKATSRTTVRFSQMKEGDKPTTIFLVSDASRMAAQKSVVDIIQYCFLQEIKRHKNKSRPVYLIGDEATFNEIFGLEELLVWGRAVGLHLKVIFQNLPSFRRVYGKEALATLLSETEIKLFLPGQREPETLEMIEKMLGNESVIAEGRSGNTQTPDYWISGTDYREDGKPLMTADEIRRTDKGILFIRRNKPMLVDLPSVASIDPFRDQLDINPYHGKPYRLPIQLRIDRDEPKPLPLWQRIRQHIHKPRPSDPAIMKYRTIKKAMRFRSLSTLVTLWPLALLLLFFLSPIGPHLRWSYDYRQFGSGGTRYLSNCAYLGSRGFITPDVDSQCPLLVFIDSRDWTR